MSKNNKKKKPVQLTPEQAEQLKQEQEQKAEQLKQEQEQRQQELQKQAKKTKIIRICAVLALVCAVGFAVPVVLHYRDITAAKRENADLRRLREQELQIDELLREMNPEYVAWLTIDGTEVDYPVVRGDDNVKYLETTFKGEKNRVGAIFMDFRNRWTDFADFDNIETQHIIIYGHQARAEGSGELMFGGLYRFMDADYLAAHPTITLNIGAELYEYEIFSARETDISDPAYFLSFGTAGAFEAFLERNGAPSDAARVVTLSTCIGTNNDRRMVVQGVIR
ncbi:MAG: class B sortase [Oscillospiraceae bacterium]|nr:class B sortase [Oscillospiraceae bacterium]